LRQILRPVLDDALDSVIATVPPGRWAVGVSGGADSVALLALLRTRPELSLHVAHLDHQTRGDASPADARFVAELAARFGLPCTIRRRDEIEPGLTELPANRSARYRAIRLALFREIVSLHSLQGVLLAHHADDQAETVLHRLIRGSAPAGLAGMSPRASIGGLIVLRPLLNIRRDDLRTYLKRIGQEWREDASNQSDQYLRNRLRKWLYDKPELHETLLSVARRCRALRDWARRAAPRLSESFACGQLADLPEPLAHEASRRWLIARGAPPAQLSEAVLDRLIEMAADAASPPRRHFPGRLLVRRRSGALFVDSGSTEAK